MFLQVVLVLVLTTCNLTLPGEVNKHVFPVFLYFIQLPKSQNHWMFEVGRHLWRSSCPTSLLKKGHLDKVVQDHVQIKEFWRPDFSYAKVGFWMTGWVNRHLTDLLKCMSTGKTGTDRSLTTILFCPSWREMAPQLQNITFTDLACLLAFFLFLNKYIFSCGKMFWGFWRAGAWSVRVVFLKKNTELLWLSSVPDRFLLFPRRRK